MRKDSIDIEYELDEYIDQDFEDGVIDRFSYQILRKNIKLLVRRVEKEMDEDKEEPLPSIIGRVIRLKLEGWESDE